MRKKLPVAITADGRDNGKTFMLTELPARQAEKWAMRALFVLAKYMDIPEHIMNSGMAGLAQLSPKMFLSATFAEVEPLMDEMLSCVRIIRDARRPDMEFELTGDDIEEVPTLLFLRSKVWELHTGFSLAGTLSKWISAKMTEMGLDSSGTPTSPPQSVQ